MSVNKVILVGNLGNDPDVNLLPSGGTVVNFSVATTDRWTDKESGEKKEQTEWHRVVAYDRLADIVAEYVKKGRQVYVEGKLRRTKYTDKDGIERTACDIVARDVQMLGKREDNGSPD
ncbi:Single-stranded DNA-binding protein [compost metagenome]